MVIRLREWRQKRAFSQAELAAHAGVSKATIVNLEQPGRRTPHPRTVRKLAVALGVSPEDLYSPEQDDQENAR